MLVSVNLCISYGQDRPQVTHPHTPLIGSAARNYQILNINNFRGWISSDGQWGDTPTGFEGVRFPGQTGVVMYVGGFLWAAKAFTDSALTQPAPPHTIRVGAQTYNVGTQAGWVEGFGSNARPINPSDPRVRIYRIRRDFRELSNGDLLQEASDFFQIPPSQVTYIDHIQPLLAQYERDWNEWPVEHGAPYIERNGIPGYQPPPSFQSARELIEHNYDEPGIAGADPNSPADQVVFTVYNDLNPSWTVSLYGSNPLGLEVQLTAWAYKPSKSAERGNIVSERVRIINKGGVDVGGGLKQTLYLDSLFVAKWMDSDLGAFGDDLLGCDTLRQMAYTYNAYSNDRVFQEFNLPPPAVGWSLLQGPMVRGGATDTAIFNFAVRRGMRNLPMTSFSPKGSGTGFSDPPFGYEGTLRWWRWIQGYIPDPSTTPWRMYPSGPFAPTFFPFWGDPVTRQGFIDGQRTSYSFWPGDRRFSMNSGPFRLAPGDTQEVVIAMIGGLGADNLTSITALRFFHRFAEQSQRTLFAGMVPPPAPHVKLTELDGEVILEWGSNLSRIQEIESFANLFHRFEGYNVYQLPRANAPLSAGKRIATFDIVNGVLRIIGEQYDVQSGLGVPVPIQDGTDSGIRRYLRVTTNAFASGEENRRLPNGQE
ncbi:MAG: hypothetical protein C4326_09915 [Ignavibacteria bacterium]